MKRFFILFVISTMNGYFHVMSMPMWRAEEGVFPIAIFGFGFFWGVYALLHNVAIVVLGLLATPEKPVLLWISLALDLLGIFLDLVNPLFGIIIAILFVIGLIDSKKAMWIKQQPGYPYFNERFTEQESIAFHDYQADHHIRDMADSDMQDISEARDIIPTPAVAEMPDVDFLIPDVSQTPPALTKENTSKPVAAPTIAAEEFTAPMVAETPAQPVKPPKKRWNFKKMMQAEEKSDVPKVDFDIPTDIPDPVWDVPDPVLDTASILSSVPEINGDIQDLPDIPDIPQI